MRWGYGRVSSKGQRLYGMSLEDQLERLLAQGIDQEHILLDTYTGTKIDRPKFNEVLSKLEPGDELVVCKLDRFARTAPEGAMLVRDLVERGIKVNILNMGVADNTPMGKVMVTVMLAFAEYERDSAEVPEELKRITQHVSYLFPRAFGQWHMLQYMRLAKYLKLDRRAYCKVVW